MQGLNPIIRKPSLLCLDEWIFELQSPYVSIAPFVLFDTLHEKVKQIFVNLCNNKSRVCSVGKVIEKACVTLEKAIAMDPCDSKKKKKLYLPLSSKCIYDENVECSEMNVFKLLWE